MDEAQLLLRLLPGLAQEPEPQALQQHPRDRLEDQAAPVRVGEG